MSGFGSTVSCELKPFQGFLTVLGKVILAVQEANKEALTAEGTLMTYASCPQYTDEVGRGHLTAEQEKEILEKFPSFDPQTARAQRENGILVEFFRTYPDSRINSHVARFVVWGKQTEYLISEQPWTGLFAFKRPSKHPCARAHPSFEGEAINARGPEPSVELSLLAEVNESYFSSEVCRERAPLCSRAGHPPGP